MELAASQTINAPRDRVWAALNDPETLKACIPGADSVEQVSDAEYAVAMTAAVGPVKARFKAKLLLTDVVPPERYTLTFDGQGGTAGFSKGSAAVALLPLADGKTQMDYRVNAQIGGKLAQVGQRLIDAAAKKVADDFFGRFRKAVEPAAAADGDAPEALEAAGRTPSASTGSGVMWWVGALLLAMALMGYLGRGAG